MKSKTIRVDQIAYLIPIKILCVLISSVTRWLDYLLILSHMQQWKFGQWHKCWPKQVHIFAQHKISPHIIAKDFKNIAKMAIFCQIWSHWSLVLNHNPLKNVFHLYTRFFRYLKNQILHFENSVLSRWAVTPLPRAECKHYILNVEWRLWLTLLQQSCSFEFRPQSANCIDDILLVFHSEIALAMFGKAWFFSVQLGFEDQCDQMAWLFFKHLDIDNNESLPNSI